MSREVPFFENDICDVCGAKGAYDFMGDQLCSDCSRVYINNEYCMNDLIEDGQTALINCPCHKCSLRI